MMYTILEIFLLFIFENLEKCWLSFQPLNSYMIPTDRLDICCPISFSKSLDFLSICHPSTTLFCLKHNVIGNCCHMGLKYFRKDAKINEVYVNWICLLFLLKTWKKCWFFFPALEFVHYPNAIHDNPYFSTHRTIHLQITIYNGFAQCVSKAQPGWD